MDWYHWVIIVVIFLLIGQMIGSYIGFKYIIPKKPQTKPLIERDLENSNLRGYEHLVKDSFDFLDSLTKEDIYIKSKDNLKLHACYINNNSNKTVVFAHGYRSRAYNDFSLPIRRLYQEGYNIFYIDQRCHGQSEGKYVTFGIKERIDLVDWVNYINENYKPESIILYGMSMGCATTSMSLPLMPKNVKAAVLDCGFSSMFKLMVKQTRKMIKVNAIPSVIFMDIYCRIIAGFSMFTSSSRKALKKINIPCFFIHGKADSVVPFKHGVENYNSCKSEIKECAFVDDAEHGICNYVLYPQLENRVVEFINNSVEE